MPKRSKSEEDEYEFSLCSEDAIQLYYPAGMTPKHYLFEKSMVELQIALIKCKDVIMYPSDKKRAKKTLTFLKNKLRTL